MQANSNGTGSSAFAGRVPQTLKITYAFGAMAETVIYIAFNSFNFFFYTNILGIPGTMAGLAVTIALIFDAITDPLIGTISDRWHSRLGRRHPFMFAAPLPVMFCLFMIYSPPEDLSNFNLFLWLTVFTVTMRSCISLFHVPHLALGAELSSHYIERSRVMSINTLMGALGTLGFSFLALSLFFSPSEEYSNGMLNASAYPRMAITAALLGGGIMLISTVFTMSVIPKLPPAPRNLPSFSFREFMLDCKSALDNRNYLFLLVGYLFLGATIGTRVTLEMHLYNYFWQLLPAQIRYFPLMGIIASILGFMITAPLHQRYDKKPVLISCMVIALTFLITPTLLRLMGFFPENNTYFLLPILLSSYLVAITAAVVGMISTMSALADIADEQELQTHRRQEGTLYAARAFFGKASSGLGHLFAGIAIDIIAFPVGTEPGTVDADTLFKLGLVDGPIAVIPGIIAIFFYGQYSLTRTRHAEIQATLNQRNGAPEPVFTN